MMAILVEQGQCSSQMPGYGRHWSQWVNKDYETLSENPFPILMCQTIWQIVRNKASKICKST